MESDFGPTAVPTDPGAHEGLVASVVRQNAHLPKHLRLQYGEDLLQEGRIGLLLALRDFDPEKGSFATVAVPYIRSRVVDAARRLGRHPTYTVPILSVDESSEEEDDDPIYGSVPRSEATQEEETYLSELVTLVRAFLETLRPYERDVVLARFWGEESQAAIARRLGVSRQRVNRILKDVCDRGQASLGGYLQ